ncbi:hypothetical protein D3C83_230800 [compost metagenome]
MWFCQRTGQLGDRGLHDSHEQADGLFAARQVGQCLHIRRLQQLAIQSHQFDHQLFVRFGKITDHLRH